MSATIGAALKKIAVALLTDKKVIKTIGGIVIGIIIIVVMPIVAVVSVFNGSMDIDTDKSISLYKKTFQPSRWKIYSLLTTQ